MDYQTYKVMRLAELENEKRWPDGADDPHNYINGLLDLLGDINPKRVVEVGAYRGISTEAFLLLCDHVTTVDAWTDGRRDEFFERCGQYPHLNVVEQLSPLGLRFLHTAEFDMCYIDGAHDYDSVKADILACERVVKPNGFICGHDWGGDVAWAVKDILRVEPKVYSDTSWSIPCASIRTDFAERQKLVPQD